MDSFEFYVKEYRNDKWYFYMKNVKPSGVKVKGVPQDIVDAVLTAACYLGLEDVYNYIVGSKAKITDPQILAVVSDTEKEIGDTISDPYSGMRN